MENLMPRGRPKKVKDEEPILKETGSKFGWCITGHHDMCIKVISNGIECNCKCHKARR
jgi:hypothetical protein